MKVIKEGLSKRKIKIKVLSDKLKEKIQKTINSDDSIKRVTCLYCKSVISYSRNDVLYSMKNTKHTLTCPQCGKTIELTNDNFDGFTVDNLLKRTSDTVLERAAEKTLIKEGKDKEILQAVANYFDCYVARNSLNDYELFKERPTYNRKKKAFVSKSEEFLGFVCNLCFIPIMSDLLDTNGKKALYIPVSKKEKKTSEEETKID